MKCIILCAGYATRLWPLTQDNPKPLLEVAGKPIVEHILSKVEEVGEIDNVFIVTNNKFYNNFTGWLKNYKSKKKIKIINDKTSSNEDRLGAIGDVNFAIENEKIDDDLLIIAGDNLFEFSLKEIINIFKEKKASVIALYDVKDKNLAKEYGIVDVDKNNKIIGFEEKPAEPKSTLASTGIYLYPKKTARRIAEYIKEENSPDKTGSFLAWLYNKEDVYCYISKKRWHDIGSFEQLEEAKRGHKK